MSLVTLQGKISVFKCEKSGDIIAKMRSDSHGKGERLGVLGTMTVSVPPASSMLIACAGLCAAQWAVGLQSDFLVSQ